MITIGSYPKSIIESFDTLTDQSSVLASIPSDRDPKSVAMLNGILYFFGAFHPPWNGTEPHRGDSTVLTYNLSSGNWGYAPSNSNIKFVDRLTYAIGVGDRIFVFVPAQSAQYARVDSLQLWEYNPLTGSVEKKNPMPYNDISNPILCENQGNLFVLGGRGWSSWKLNFFRKFDPVSNTWQTLPDMPFNDIDGAGWVDGKLYAVGGYKLGPDGFTANPVMSAMEEFDPVENKWRNVLPTLLQRENRGVIALGSKIYLSGGRFFTGTDYIEFKSIEEYTP